MLIFHKNEDINKIGGKGGRVLVLKGYKAYLFSETTYVFVQIQIT